jgi:tRNA (guanine37-N1)-methyltransferase
MRIDMVTLFPEMFLGPFGDSITKRAIESGILDIHYLNFRDYSFDKHHHVDDSPFGGGAGMVLKPEPLFAAVEDAKTRNPDAKVVLMTPKGKIWDQARASELANSGDNYIFICPHYEGYDERILTLVDYQVSIGKFILTGGELPAMTVIDSIVRLIPGVLGGETSAEIESFSDGDNYEYPQYTRPAEFRGMKVPEVLLNGNHGEIAKWRAANAPTKPADK